MAESCEFARELVAAGATLIQLREKHASGREILRLARELRRVLPNEVTLIAVSKTVPADRIVPALDAGITNLGENRVQEAESKIGVITAVLTQDLSVFKITRGKSSA